MYTTHMNIPEKTQQLIDTLLRERDEARDQVAHLLLEKAEAAVAFRDEIHRLTLERDEARRECCMTWEMVMGREARNVAADKGWDCFDNLSETT